MIPTIIYILGTILGGVAGMLLLGFLYYRKKYSSLKIKYDELGGDDLLTIRDKLESTQSENNKLRELNDKLSEKKRKRSRRRGLFKKELERGGDKIKLECEVCEIDRAKDKSKIEVTHINCNETLSEKNREQVRELIEGWIDSDKIQWLERPPGEVRNDAIDDILEDTK